MKKCREKRKTDSQHDTEKFMKKENALQDIKKRKMRGQVNRTLEEIRGYQSREKQQNVMGKYNSYDNKSNEKCMYMEIEEQKGERR